MFPKAVIDSGPLFSALVINYDMRGVRLGRSPRFTHVLTEPLQTSGAQKLLLDLLYSIGRRLTTSHAIAELTGIESRLRLYGDDLLDFWRTSIDLLRQWDIDETLIRLLDLASDKAFEECLPRIGITDTGLIELALKNRCVLITEDERTLASQAGAMGVDCRLVRNLVAPAS